MVFVKNEVAYNIYGEYAGREMTCLICGRSAFIPSNPSVVPETLSCITYVREWDGGIAGVHIDHKDEQTVRMRYSDGTVHIVARRYFDAINIG